MNFLKNEVLFVVFVFPALWVSNSSWEDWTQFFFFFQKRKGDEWVTRVTKTILVTVLGEEVHSLV